MTTSDNQVLAKLASIVMAVSLLAAPVYSQSVQTLTDVEMVGSETDSPPAADAAWQQARLPYFSSFTKADSAPAYLWFRFWLPAASDGNTQALFIARHMRNVDLYVNGVRLYSERAGNDSDYIGWNTPLLVELQPATLQHERNEIVLGLKKSIGSSYLNSIRVGPQPDVQLLYRSAWFNQTAMPLAALIASLILSVLAFGVWIMRRQHTEYLVYCGACTAWAGVMWFMLQPTPPLPLQQWMVLSYFNTNIAGLCVVAFISRVLGFTYKRWLRGMLAVTVIGCLLSAVLPAAIGIALALPLHVMTLSAMLYTGYRTLALLIKQPDRKVLGVAVSLLPLVVLPLVDLARYANVQLNDGGFAGTTLMQFGFPFSLAILFTHLVHQLWSALDNNTRLQQERLNIYRDLHDDVGAKLTSILHTTDTVRQKQMARAALESLRETIHHANHVQQTLQEWLQEAVAEMQVRLHAAGICFDATIATTLPERQLSSSEGYHLSRALREVTSNILHHSRASRVSLTVSCITDRNTGGNDSSNNSGITKDNTGGNAPAIVLVIQDDGRGFEPAAAAGNGLAGIRQRLQESGGSAQWQSQPGQGCQVTLELSRAVA